MDFISKLLHLNPGDKRNIPRNQSAKSGQLSDDHIVHENSKDQLAVGEDRSLGKSTSNLTGSSSTFSSAVEFDTDGSPDYDSACENDALLDQEVEPNQLSVTLLADNLNKLYISTPRSVLKSGIPNSSLIHSESDIREGASIIENINYTEEPFDSGDRNIKSTCKKNLSELYDDVSSSISQSISITSDFAEDTKISFSGESNKELNKQLLLNEDVTSSATKITADRLCIDNLSVQNTKQSESFCEDTRTVSSIIEFTKVSTDTEISQSPANLSLELDKNISAALSVASNISNQIESSSVNVENIDTSRNSVQVEDLLDNNTQEVKSEDQRISLTDSSEEKEPNESSIIISSVVSNEEIKSTVDNFLISQINDKTIDTKFHNLNTVEDIHKNITCDSKYTHEIGVDYKNFTEEVSVDSFPTEVNSEDGIHSYSEYSVDGLHEPFSFTQSPANIENCSVKLNLTESVPIDGSSLPKDSVIQDIKSFDLSTNIVPSDSVHSVEKVIVKTSPLPSCENNYKQDQPLKIVGTQFAAIEQSFEIVETNVVAETVEKSFEVVESNSACESTINLAIPQQLSDCVLSESNASLNSSSSETTEKFPVVPALSDCTLKKELSFNELKSDEKVENISYESLSAVSHEVNQISSALNNLPKVSEDILTDNTANISVIPTYDEVNCDIVITEDVNPESVEKQIVTVSNETTLTSAVQKIEPAVLKVVENSFEVAINPSPETDKKSFQVSETDPSIGSIIDKPLILPISDITFKKSNLSLESTELKTEGSTPTKHVVPDSNLKTELSFNEHKIDGFNDILLSKVENIVTGPLCAVIDEGEQFSETTGNSKITTEVINLSNILLSNTETIYNKLVADGTISETVHVPIEDNNIVSSELQFSVSVKENNSVESSDILNNTSDDCVGKGFESNTVNETLENLTGDAGKIKSTLDCSIVEGVNELPVEAVNNQKVFSESENCSEGIIKRRSTKEISQCFTKLDDSFVNESIVDVEFDGYKSSLDSSGDSSTKIHKVNGELNKFSVPEEVDGQDFDADSIEELQFDESLSVEASKISETILNNSNDSNIVEDYINNMNTPVSAKSQNTEIFVGNNQSVSKFLNMDSDMNVNRKNEQACHNNSIGNDVQVKETSNFNLNVNNSEAGPATAEEFTSASSFQFDINYLSQAGQNSHRSGLSSLTRQSLYVKFDPIVGKILSSTEESPRPSGESGEPVFQTPMKYPESERDGQLIVFTPGPSNTSESYANDSDYNKSEAGPATADNELSESSSNLDCTIQEPESSPKTPMKNSSIERKTASPSASLEKSQSTPKSGQKTVVSQEVYHKEVQKLQDLMEQMVVQENKYKDELGSKNEQNEKLQTQLNERNEKYAEAQKEIGNLQKENQEKTKNIKQLGLILEEYERTISQMLAQKEEEKKEFQNQNEVILKERDTAMTHLNNMEIAFNDVHQKYERSKTVIEAMKNNEDVLKASVQNFEAAMSKQEDKYNKLRVHAMTELEKANLELDMLKRSHETEIARLSAIVKKSEIRITALDEALDRKSKENLELTQLCDELISKVTGESVENPA